MFSRSLLQNIGLCCCAISAAVLFQFWQDFSLGMVLLNLFLCSTAMTKTLSQMIHFFLIVRSQQWTYVRVVDIKSPSFVCLTSEVRVLFVASCFEVCSQQYGQCLFVSPRPFCLRLSPTKLFGLIPWQPNPVRRSSHYLYRDKINSWEWRLNLISREWSDKLTVLYSPSVITLSSFCDRKPVWLREMAILYASRQDNTK